MGIHVIPEITQNSKIIYIYIYTYIYGIMKVQKIRTIKKRLNQFIHTIPKIKQNDGRKLRNSRNPKHYAERQHQIKEITKFPKFRQNYKRELWNSWNSQKYAERQKKTKKSTNSKTYAYVRRKTKEFLIPKNTHNYKRKWRNSWTSKKIRRMTTDSWGIHDFSKKYAAL